MVPKLQGWIAAHLRWFVAIFVAIAILSLAISVLLWKMSLRPDRLAGVDLLVAQFDRVVLLSEPDREAPERIVKWTGQLRIKIVGDDAGLWKDAIDRQVVTLRELTGLDIVVGPVDGMRENYFIYFADPSEKEGIIIEHIKFPGPYLESPEDGNCAGFFVYPYRVIKQSLLLISTDVSDRLIAGCISQLMVSMFGFSNSSELIRPSVFSSWDYNLYAPSINDRIIIRTLYDKRMHLGLYRYEALEVARLIIAELVAEARAKEAQAGD